MNKIVWVEVSRYINNDFTLLTFERQRFANTYELITPTRVIRAQRMLDELEVNSKPLINVAKNCMRVNIPVPIKDNTIDN